MSMFKHLSMLKQQYFQAGLERVDFQRKLMDRGRLAKFWIEKLLFYFLTPGCADPPNGVTNMEAESWSDGDPTVTNTNVL